MKYLLVFIFLTIFLAGCTPSIENEAVAEKKSSTAVVAEITSTAEEAPTPTITPSETPQNTSAAPSVISTPLERSGWQTFTSPALGVAIEYPPDWSVMEDASGASFTSPQGNIIALSRMNANNNNEIMIGNRRCVSRTNSHNMTADVCIETISFSYSATVNITNSDGSSGQLMLRTIDRIAIKVFDAMFDSLHPLK